MHFEDIGDAIEVIAYFKGGKMQPVKFRWKNRVHRIERVNGGWRSEQGRERIQHYSVMCGGPDVFEISCSMENFTWRIDRVCLEG